jgi:tetratricopeptide (TPR) repeat protein
MRWLILCLALPVAATATAQTVNDRIARGDSVSDHIARGDSTHDRLDPAAALAHYEAALAVDSSSYEALWKAARSVVDIGKQLGDDEKQARDSVFAVADSYARIAVAVNPDAPDGHFMLAQAVGRLALTKGPKERVQYAKEVRLEALRALELDSLHDGAHHVIGRWHAEIMRLPSITKFFAKAFLGGAVFDEASWDSAVWHLERATELRPTNVYHHLDLAKIYLAVERPEDAQRHFLRLLELPDTDVVDPASKEEARAHLATLGGQS